MVTACGGEEQTVLCAPLCCEAMLFSLFGRVGAVGRGETGGEPSNG